MRMQRGFTLIELMVVVAIVAILAAIAIPAFTEQMRKSRRSEAMQHLSDLQLRQERRRANNATYAATLADLGVTSSTISTGSYVLSISLPTTGACPGGAAVGFANSYVLTATKDGAQSQDLKCTTMVITNQCGTVTKTSTGGGQCW